MALDFAKPATSDNYSTQFVPNLQGNLVGLAQLLDSAQTTVTGTVPQYVKRYNRTTTALEEWSGSAWAPITLQGIRFSGGNLAIGVAPIASVPLTVHTGSNRNLALFDQASQATLSAVTDAGGASTLRLAGSTLVLSGDGSTEHARLNSSGNLGLGTGSPIARLDVLGPVGSINDTAGTVRVSTDVAGTDALDARGAGIVFAQRWQAASGTARVAGIYGVKGSGTGNFGGRLIFTTQPATGADMVEQMRLDEEGRLGIGTAPSARLHVNSGGNIEVLRMQANANPFMSLYVGSTRRFYIQATATELALAAENAAPMHFAVAGATRMILSTGGELGIGGATPLSGYLLDVQGQAAIRRGAGLEAKLEVAANGNVVGSTSMHFGQDTTSLGYVWNRAAAGIVFGTNSTARMTLSSSGALTPATDGGQDNGGPANRWATLYAWSLSLGVNSQAVDFSSTNLLLGGGSGWTSVTLRPGGTDRLSVANDGRVYGTALHNNANPITGTTNHYIASGTYTPTPVNNSNATSLTAREHQYIRVGRVVTVSGEISAGATAANTVTTVRIPLPIASTFSGFGQGSGVVWVGGNSPFAVGCVEMDATNQVALLRYIPTATGTAAIKYFFQYEVR